MRIHWFGLLLSAFAGVGADRRMNGPGEDEIPFEALGRELLAACDARREKNAPDLPKDASKPVALMTRLLPMFHRIPMGAIEIWEPKNQFGDLSKGEKGEATPVAVLQEHANLCIRVQKLWLDRAPLDDPTRTLVKKNIAIVEGWVKSWRAEGPPRRKIEEEEALQQIAATFHAIPKDGQLDMGALPVLFIMNTRRQYFSLLGASGLVDPAQQKLLWDPKARTWVLGGVNYRCNAVVASWGPAEGRGSPLLDNPMPKASAEQYITHQFAHTCIDLMMREVPPWVSEGLALCDTIQIVKADETRCSGNIAAAFVADVGGFMPGQKEDFRWMPTAPAEKSPYRRGPSAHFFTKELQRARGKNGMKVIDYETGKSVQIPLPLLLPVEKVPDLVLAGTPALKAGYSEFFRAYVACFAHFLFLESKGNRAPLFPQLLITLQQIRAGTPRPEHPFHEAVKKLTGKSVGVSVDARQDWEGAYLEWLDSTG